MVVPLTSCFDSDITPSPALRHASVQNPLLRPHLPPNVPTLPSVGLPQLFATSRAGALKGEGREQVDPKQFFRLGPARISKFLNRLLYFHSWFDLARHLQEGPHELPGLTPARLHITLLWRLCGHMSLHHSGRRVHNVVG
jgi:hypothetical protein